MIKEKTMRAGLIAAAAFVLIGMLFVPAVAADGIYVVDPPSPNYDGNKPLDWGTTDGVEAKYNDATKTITVEPTGATPLSFDTTPLNVTQVGGLDDQVKIIEVNSTINLKDAANVFSKFVNAELWYLQSKDVVENPNTNLFGSSNPIFKVNATNSTVMVYNMSSNEQIYTGKAITVDTDWAVAGQKVKVAVKPLQNYSVYGWEVYQGTSITGIPLAESAYDIVKSSDPEDGATTYILTMPAFHVTLSPMLRDSGSTIVTYVFLDAETYVLEIPADFSLKGLGESKAVKDKMVNLTGCDIFSENHLQVTMNSTNDMFSEDLDAKYKVATGTIPTGNLFVLKNVKTPASLGAYSIGAQKHYADEPDFTLVSDEDVVLDTIDVKATVDGKAHTGDDEAIYAKIGEGNLKTELEFTLWGINAETLGKYKDKLTFTVGIVKKP